jgi:HSP20 family protein
MYYKFSNLDNELDRVFGEAFGLSKSSKIVEENYEINQTKDGAYLFFEAPGFNKTNLKVEMEDGMITINGKRTYEINKQEKVKTISKKFTVGTEYDAESIEATIEDGLLTVFVPNFKKKEKKKISLL